MPVLAVLWVLVWNPGETKSAYAHLTLIIKSGGSVVRLRQSDHDPVNTGEYVV